MNKINNNEYLTDLTRRIQNMTITFSPIIDHSYNLGSLIFLMIIQQIFHKIFVRVKNMICSDWVIFSIILIQASQDAVTILGDLLQFG